MNQDPEFIKYPEIPHLAEALDILDGKVQVFEKIDGGNCQVRMSNGRLFCGSRANFLKRKEFFRFDWFKDFNRWAMSNPSLRSLSENLIVYGEFAAYHTLTYLPEFTNRFFLIDIYDLNSERFLPYGKSRGILEDKLHTEDILFLDSLAKGRVNLDSVNALAMGPSQYSPYEREGVVIKDYRRQKFAKLWRTSVIKTRGGLLEEIRKTIKSLKTKYPSVQSFLETTPADAIGLPDLVYEELLRSGRLDVSLAEISDAARKVANKI